MALALNNNDLALQLEKARKGDESSLAAVIAAHMGLIRKYAARAEGPGLDFDDAVQEGLIALFNAIQGFEAENAAGAGFSTYASACIQNAILSAQKAAGRKKHAPLNQSVPLNEDQSIPGPEDAAIASDEVATVLERARDRLSPFERTVLSMYLEGYSYKEIAQRMGKTSKAVDNAMLRIRRKLK